MHIALIFSSCAPSPKPDSACSSVDTRTYAATRTDPASSVLSDRLDFLTMVALLPAMGVYEYSGVYETPFRTQYNARPSCCQGDRMTDCDQARPNTTISIGVYARGYAVSIGSCICVCQHSLAPSNWVARL